MSIAYWGKEKTFLGKIQGKGRGKQGVNKGKVTASVGQERGDPGKMHKTEGADLTK